MNAISDGLRDNMLMLVNNVLTKEEMLSVGSVVGEKTYADMRKHVEEHNYQVKWPGADRKIVKLAENLNSLFHTKKINDLSYAAGELVWCW